MNNNLVKETSIDSKELNTAIIESEFDLDIRVFTLAPSEDGKMPQAVTSVVGCSYSCSCATCPAAGNSCWTCTCWPHC